MKSTMAGIQRKSKVKPMYKLKCVVVGDLGVGKTTLVRSFAEEGQIKGEKIHHRGMWKKEIIMDSCAVYLSIWDTAGQERYRSLTGSYYRGAHCCMIVFDVNSLTSFQNVREWYDNIEEYAEHPNEIIKMLVGTIRKQNHRAVSPEKAERLAEHLGLSYQEIDFESQNNVKDLFETLADLTLVVYRENKFQSNVPVILLPKKRQKTSLCSC
ncbi:ras-related protein Rab-8B-like [Saccostrea cucullata]|uniref:ras-related protein Rab-8B-like n=1 Tax=Saccostrea cuccullata TaxID=36930 RepID=UPI002ED6BBD6